MAVIVWQWQHIICLKLSQIKLYLLSYLYPFSRGTFIGSKLHVVHSLQDTQNKILKHNFDTICKRNYHPLNKAITYHCTYEVCNNVKIESFTLRGGVCLNDWNVIINSLSTWFIQYFKSFSRRRTPLWVKVKGHVKLLDYG